MSGARVRQEHLCNSMGSVRHALSSNSFAGINTSCHVVYVGMQDKLAVDGGP